MPEIIRSEIKHHECDAFSVLPDIAETVRINPNGETLCTVCGQSDVNLNFSSTIEFDNGYILERVA
jgi:hypothetical protein